MKHLSKFFTLLTFFALSTTFVACSSDDDDDSGGTAKASVFQLTTVNGDRVYLKSNGLYTFTYDNDGFLSGWGNYTVSYNPMTIKYEYDDGVTTTVSLNSSGYISSVNESYYEKYSDGDSYSASGKMSLSYNGNGQLSSLSFSDSGTDIDDGDKYTYSGNGSASFEYSNGVLKSVTWKYNAKAEGYSYSWTDKYTYTYDDSSYENKTRQYTHSLASCLDDFEFDDLCFVGLFGKASYELPTEVTWSENEDGDSWTGYDTYTYTFNDDGTVEREYYNSKNYYYAYTYWDVDDIISTKASVADTRATTDGSVKKPRSLFRSLREKAKAIQAQEQQ